MIPIIVIASILLLGVAIFLICYFVQGRYKKFVVRNSLSLKCLQEINSKYDFHPYQCLDQYHTYDNEKVYDTVSCTDYLIYQLQFIEKSVLEQIKKANSNKQKYDQYLSEFQNVPQLGSFSAPIGWLRRNKLIQIEQRLMKLQKYSTPYVQFELLVVLRCAKMSGRIYDAKSKHFYENDIRVLLRRLHDKRGNFYNDREIWDALCRVERGKVSNRMRFSIYERDGYRCRRCGVSGQYDKSVRLEIDHIIPIAKGGKSTMDNLQTLCHTCNIYKGAD